MGAVSYVTKKMYQVLRKLLKNDSNPYIDEVPAIKIFSEKQKKISIEHVAMYSSGNAGDIILPRSVRDSFDFVSSSVNWKGCHAHRIVTESILSEINEKDGLLIGGGGLFLCDTNPNKRSGWQWNCSVDALRKIKIPIALFGVGYNRFREQDDFMPVFKKHLNLLAEKSVYIALRNHGSLNAIKKYLPVKLHDKLRYQPCPTTICSNLYPELIIPYTQYRQQKTFALNCAFDRIDNRLKRRTDKILLDLAGIMKRCILTGYNIEYFAHTPSDEIFLPYLDRLGVPYEVIRLYNVHPRNILKAYSRVSLAIGMRGHAQMIPFGCGTPILSLISHDKLQWFLDDIGHPEWGVEMLDESFPEILYEKIIASFSQQKNIEKEISLIQKNILQITSKNVKDFISYIN